jgi:hypothetical protein
MRHSQCQETGAVTIKLGPSLKSRLQRWLKVAYVDSNESPTRSDIVRRWLDERLTEEIRKLPVAKRKMLEE